jgi:hypothetical protein
MRRPRLSQSRHSNAGFFFCAYKSAIKTDNFQGQGKATLTTSPVAKGFMNVGKLRSQNVPIRGQKKARRGWRAESISEETWRRQDVL